MTVDVKKAAIDIGIITKDIDAMMTFYRDTLGLEFEASNPIVDPRAIGDRGLVLTNVLARNEAQGRVEVLLDLQHAGVPAPDVVRVGGLQAIGPFVA